MTRRRWKNWSSSWFRKCHLHGRDDSSPALPSPCPRSSWWSSRASSCGTEGTRAPQSQRSALHGQCLKKVTREHFGQFITIRAAEELPWVGYTAFVELHGVCVQADRDWAVLEEPLKCKSKKGHCWLSTWAIWVSFCEISTPPVTLTATLLRLYWQASSLPSYLKNHSN